MHAALMIGLGLSSILVGLFDVKHYFHLQVGVVSNALRFSSSIENG
jgi:hypothetical protein